MNASPAHDLLDTLATAFAATLRKLGDADVEVRALHRQLADTIDPDGARWDALQHAHRSRRSLAAELGFQALTWTREGGEVALMDPEEPDAASEDHDHPPDDTTPHPSAMTARSSTEARAEPTSPSPQPEHARALPHPSPAPEAPRPAPSLKVAPRPPDPPARTPSAPAVVSPSPATATVSTPAPAAVPSTPRPKAPPASPADLRRLLSQGIGSAAPTAASAPQLAEGRAHLDSALHHLAQPMRPTDLPWAVQWCAQIRSLEALPTAEQRLGLELFALRLRGLQARMGERAELPVLFKRLTAWSKAAQPGSVHGLARSNTPRRVSWDADADALHPGMPVTQANGADPVDRGMNNPERLLAALGEDLSRLSEEELRERTLHLLRFVQRSDPRLIKLLADHYDCLKGSRELKGLRKHIKQHLRAERSSEPKAEPKGSPPEDWPLWHLTEGKRAVMVGGDPRVRNRDQIRDAFRLARLDWPDCKPRNALESIAQKVRNGTYELVIFNRFSTHKVDDKVMPHVSGDLSRWVRAESGYGVAELRKQMEAHWKGLVSSDDAKNDVEPEVDPQPGDL